MSFRTIAFVVAIPYLILFATKPYFAHGQFVFGIVNTLLQLSLDVYAVLLARKQGNKLIAASFALSAVTGAVYGTCLQILGITHFDGTLELVVNTLYLSFLVTAGTSLAVIERGGELGAVVAALLGFASMMVFGTRIWEILPSRQTQVIHFFCLIAESYLLGFASIRIVRPKSAGVRAIGLGFACIAMFGFLLQYIELYAKLSVGLPLELLWTLGQFLVIVGLRQRG